jgi:hypothetical protein
MPAFIVVARESSPPRGTLTTSHFTERRIGLGLLAAAMVASALVLLLIGHGQTVQGDELGYATRLATQGLGHALFDTPPNKYLIPVPLVVYRAMFEVFGLDHYFAHRVVAVVLVLLCAGLFYEYARRRVGYLLALAPTVLLLFYGSGWETVLTAMRLPSLIAVACGLGALLALEKRTLVWDAIAAVLLCAAVTSHPTGLAFTAAAAVVILLSPTPGRWQRAWVFVAPAVIFGVWYLVGRTTTPTPFPTTFSDVFRFVRQSWVMVSATVTGLSGVVPIPVYRQPIAQALGALLFAFVAVVAILRFRRMPPAFWAALVGFGVVTAGTRISHPIFVTADQNRYLFPEAVLFLLIFAGLAGPFKLPRWAQWATVVAILLGVVVNVDNLRDGAVDGRATSHTTLGQLSAVELAGPNLQPGYEPSLLDTTAGQDLAAMRKFGSPALNASELASAPLGTRTAADRMLAGSLGLALDPSTTALGKPGSAPQVVQERAGRAVARNGCISVSPRSSGQPAAALAELSLPRDGVSLSARDLSQVHVLLGKFADPSVALPLASGHVAVLETPEDETGVPWKLTVIADREVTVCGLSAQ